MKGVGCSVVGLRDDAVAFIVEVSGFMVWVLRFRFSGQGSRLRIQCAGCRVQDAGCRVDDLGLRVEGSGFRGQDLGLRVGPPRGLRRQRVAEVSSCTPRS